MYKTAKVVIILVCWAMVMGLTLLWDKIKGGKSRDKIRHD